METRRMFSLLSACVYALTTAPAVQAAPTAEVPPQAAQGDTAAPTPQSAAAKERGAAALRSAPADDLLTTASSVRPVSIIQSKSCDRGCLAA